MLRSLALAAPLLAGISACSSLSLSRVYLHDDAAQSATESAATAWKAALPTAVFDQQKTFLTKLASDEVSTAKLMIAAQRDLQLVELLDHPDGMSQRDELNKRLLDLAGTTPADPALDKKVADDRVAISNITFDVGVWTRQLAILDGFRGTAPTCGGTLTAPDSSTDDQKADFVEIKVLCDDLGQKQSELAGDLGKPDGGGGKLAATQTTLSATAAELDRQQKQAAALTKVLEEKKKAVQDAKSPTLAQKAGTELQFCLGDPSASADKNATSSANGATLGSEINTCIVNAAQQADAVVKQLKHTELRDEIQSVLTSMLNENAANSGTTVAPSTSPWTTAALRTVNTLADAADAINKNRQPGVNDLLVALAYEQYQVDVNGNTVATLKQRISILQERREANVSEISNVARALQEIGKSPANRDIGRIRAYVNASWNIGAYREMLTEYANDDLTRSDSLRASTTIVAAWQNVLQPAFDELSTYGKGGLDAQTLSNLAMAVINAGGFAAVAKGVN
jgi:hypothetical protein